MQVKKQQLIPDMEQWIGSKLGKECMPSCMLSPNFFSLYVEYFMKNAKLDVSQDGIKIAGRNIYSLRYADDTTVMAEIKRN